MEASLRATQAELAATEAELEKQNALNDKLENDLLQMDQRKSNGDSNGAAGTSDSATANSGDVLAGLDLGKKSDVRI